MAGIGRIIQIAGWLWVAAGFLGELIGLPDVGVLPGIVLIFISRVLRGRTRRGQGQQEDHEQGQAAEEPAEPPRMLNTEREYRPVPERRHEQPEDPEVVVEVEAAEPDRDVLLERVLLAGKEVVDEPSDPDVDHSELQGDQPLSSAEMIARAHRRWDRRP